MKKLFNLLVYISLVIGLSAGMLPSIADIQVKVNGKVLLEKKTTSLKKNSSVKEMKVASRGQGGKSSNSDKKKNS